MPLNFNIAPGSYVQALVCFATALASWFVSSHAVSWAGTRLQKCWPAKTAKGLNSPGLHHSPSSCGIVFVPEKGSVHI